MISRFSSVVWPLGVVVAGSLYLIFNLLFPSSSVNTPNATRSFPHQIASDPRPSDSSSYPHDCEKGADPQRSGYDVKGNSYGVQTLVLEEVSDGKQKIVEVEEREAKV